MVRNKKRTDPHADVGAYVLGALPDREARRFERHFRACEYCQLEARGLTETMGLMGEAAAVSPPDTLRERVVAEISRTPQLSPVTAAAEPRRARSPLMTRVAAAGAAACLLVAVALGVATVQTYQRAERLEDRHQQIASVLSAPDARVTTSPDSPYGKGILVSSQSRGQLVFTLTGANDLPPSKTYQLWLIPAGGKPRSGGLLAGDGERTRGPRAIGALGNAAKVGVTVEPAGGSAQPTSTPFILLDIR